MLSEAGNSPNTLNKNTKGGNVLKSFIDSAYGYDFNSPLQGEKSKNKLFKKDAFNSMADNK